KSRADERFFDMKNKTASRSIFGFLLLVAVVFLLGILMYVAMPPGRIGTAVIQLIIAAVLGMGLSIGAIFLANSLDKKKSLAKTNVIAVDAQVRSVPSPSRVSIGIPVVSATTVFGVVAFLVYLADPKESSIFIIQLLI